ncbi:MAG: response regulator [Candidatus Latescibacterota bacterium]|jgi:putative nucleotidyltransferase with HDIG domain
MQDEILLVDDDFKVLEILEESLHRKGYKVSTAANGRQALQAVQTLNPQLVVLDMMLPDINGLEVMEQLRESPGNADVPVLILSANGDVDVRLAGLESGADDYIVKPVALKEFCTKVEKAIRRSSDARELLRKKDRLENQLSRGKADYSQIAKDLKRQLFSMKTLFAVSQDLNRVLDTEELVNVVSLTLLGELQISSLALFSLERENDQHFTLIGVKGFSNDKFAGVKVDRNGEFIRLLDESPEPRRLARNPDRTWTRILPDLRLAVFEYVTPIKVKDKIKGIVFTGPKLSGDDYSNYDKDMMMYIANSAGIGMENGRLLKQLQLTYVSTLKTLISVIEAKDPYTKGHTERVASYAVAIANRMRLSEPDRRRITFGALLHDIGKLGVAENIIFKEGKLDSSEWDVLKSHPEIGARVVDRMEFLTGTVEIVKHHHESWDGSGYPDGLEGEAIPLGARIVAVADSFDAMTTNRSYRRALSIDEAIDRMNKAAGKQFDPRIVRVFVRHIREKGYELIPA